ncbi:CrpP-related protein [Roseateles sp. 22389]|uniref:CrpP-related protein n=1 Tax=Roseateles sp. 22389 TaxID=3453916 RepID=UPI003F82757B
MKRRSKPGRHAARRDQKNSLPTAERAELQRQGAKAAARGEERHVNPMDEQLNQPSATGECPDLWQRRKDAWQQGHDVQSQTDDRASSHPSRQEESDEH